MMNTCWLHKLINFSPARQGWPLADPACGIWVKCLHPPYFPIPYLLPIPLHNSGAR